ncbi:MAG: hypothetical protein Kow00121_57890 [Elainellaceae cyanobacterium]
MIVQQTENGWQVIYHRAHALLAAQIAGYWHKDSIPTRFFETLAAIAQHDDLEREWEEDQLTEAGAPLDFTLNRESSIKQLTRLIEGAQYRGRWVALMTSMHVSFLNEANRGASKEWDRFLDHLRQQQQQWQQDLGVDKQDVERTYNFMRWCDRLSLILCQQQLPANERLLEITVGPDDQRYNVVQYQNGWVEVMPWPFFEEKFTVNVEATCLSQVSFSSNQALTEALKAAPIKILEWTFAKS